MAFLPGWRRVGFDLVGSGTRRKVGLPTCCVYERRRQNTNVGLEQLHSGRMDGWMDGWMDG